MGQKKTSQNKSGKYRAVPKGNGKGKSTAANKRDSGKSEASLSLFVMPVVLVILAIVVAISLISGENRALSDEPPLACFSDFLHAART